MRGDEHLRWFLRGRGREARRRATELAERFELPLRKLVRSYSHGMKRQLLFAAALAPRVRVRILDEPTEGLDPSRRAQILDLMREDARGGTNVLLSSHHLGEVARACDELIFLDRGRVLARESSTEIEARSRQSLRMTFASSQDAERAERRLRDLGARQVVREDERLIVDLDSKAPRETLASLYSDPDWPVPNTLTYGELSLEQLYRSLYGVEGI
jgi:ABC-type multidrug transport system ATPase subunit